MARRHIGQVAFEKLDAEEVRDMEPALSRDYAREFTSRAAAMSVLR